MLFAVVYVTVFLALHLITNRSHTILALFAARAPAAVLHATHAIRGGTRLLGRRRHANRGRITALRWAI